MAVVAAPIDINGLGVVGQAQVFIDNVLGGSQSLGLRTFLTVARENPDGFVLLWRHAYHEPQFAAYAQEFREKAVDVARTPLAAVIGGRPAIAAWAPESFIDQMVSIVLAWLDHGRPEDDDDFLATATAGLRASGTDPSKSSGTPYSANTSRTRSA